MSTISPTAPHTPKARGASLSTQQAGEVLGRYTDPRGRARELVSRPGASGSTLVIDRLAGTLADQRLVAHLAADEPLENAGIVCSLYLADVHGRRCRRVTAEDICTTPFATEQTRPASEAKDIMETGGELIDERGYLYRLESARSGSSIPELRWHRHQAHGVAGPPELVSVRQAIGGLQSYEPVRTLTAQALVSPDYDGAVSVAALRAELQRVHASPIVLNRGLREAVLAAVQQRGLTMSEIAIRCGRFRREASGKMIGETSWLGRRVGILCESGKSAPTPWVSSDVLALIARQGLGLPPRDVELG